MIRKKFAVETYGAFALAECEVSKCFCTLHRGRIGFPRLKPRQEAGDKTATTRRDSQEDSVKASYKNKNRKRLWGAGQTG